MLIVRSILAILASSGVAFAQTLPSPAFNAITGASIAIGGATLGANKIVSPGFAVNATGGVATGAATISGLAKSATFVGSGAAANIWSSLSVTGIGTSTPDIGTQSFVTSATGFANRTTAYKIGIAGGAICTVGSGDCYGANFIAQAASGTGGVLLTGFEMDMQNTGAAATDLGTSTASYGFLAVGSGSFTSTAGFSVTGPQQSFRHGFAVFDYPTTGIAGASENGFYDASTSVVAFRAGGTHTTLLAGDTCSCSFGVTLPNNIPAIYQKDSGGTLKSIIKLDNTDNVAIGYTTGFTTLYGTTLPEGDVAINWGSPTRRPGSLYTYQLFTYSTVTMTGLPTSAGGAAGTLWKDGSGYLRIN